MHMKNKLQNIFQNLIAEKQPDENQEHDIKIATAVLFLELAYADYNIAQEEETQIVKSLGSFFSLPQGDIQELLAIARDKRKQSSDIWHFTNQIKESFQRQKKIAVLEMLWKLVYADGYMDKYEEALMRKITTLLGLTHGEMIQAKLKARK
jgi:uncharacterized tellurite resistance protein B-like protein